MELEQVTQIVADFIAEADYVTNAAPISDRVWELECENEVDIVITFHAEQQRLELMSVLGTPDAENRVSVYATFLTANGLTHRNAGIRLMLDAPQGDVIQECDIPIMGLDPRTLLDTTRIFAERGHRGRQIVLGQTTA